MNNRSVHRVCVGPAGASQPSTSAGTSQVNLDNVTDLSKVCRLCTTITDLVIPIFFGEGEQNELADKIHQHLPIKVSKTDVLPTVVCCQCASTLLAWHELVKCSMQADQALRAKLAIMQQAMTAVKKEVKPVAAPNLSQPSSSAEEDSRSKAKSTYRNLRMMCPPPPGLILQRAPYVPHIQSPLRLCDYCKRMLPDEGYRQHIVDHHLELVWKCQYCEEYVDRNEYYVHNDEHAATCQEIIRLSCQYCKPKKKKAEFKKEKDVNRNNNIVPKTEPMATAPVPPTAPDAAAAYPEGAAAKPQATVAKDAKRARNNQENEFSDHSVDGFDPLPNSVFDAIEDTQDSSLNDADQASINDISEEPGESEPPAKDKNPKSHKKSRTCPICSKVYTASSSFFYHMKHTHKRVKEHECEICSKLFATRASLSSHMATHSDERRFECKKCNKRFRSNASLYIHEQTHNGVKTWSCSQCKSSFRWKTHLYRHMQRHSGEKPHICSTCGRGFNIRCDLLRHARTHQAGHFSCDKCNVKFAQQRYLKVHMEKKHAQKSGKKVKNK